MSTQPAGMARVLRPLEPSRRAPEATSAGTLPVTSLAHPQLPLELTLTTLAGPCRPLVVWGLFWGARPFSELMRHVPHVTKKALRRELHDMERLGFVRRDVRPGSNRRAEYSLTPLGQTLRPLVGAMYEWGLLRLSLERRLIGRLPCGTKET